MILAHKKCTVTLTIHWHLCSDSHHVTTLYRLLDYYYTATSLQRSSLQRSFGYNAHRTVDPGFCRDLHFLSFDQRQYEERCNENVKK